jgi:hypothetical protein
MTKITEKTLRVYCQEEKLRMRLIGSTRFGWDVTDLKRVNNLWMTQRPEGVSETGCFMGYAMEVKNRLFHELMKVDWSLEMPDSEWDGFTIDDIAEQLTWRAIDKAMEQATTSQPVPVLGVIRDVPVTYSICKDATLEQVCLPWANFDADVIEILRSIVIGIRCLEQKDPARPATMSEVMRYEIPTACGIDV